MTTTKASMIVLLAGLLAGITACIHDSDADSGSGSGPTQAQFDALKARVADLEAGLAATQELIGDRVRAGSGSGGAGKTGKQAMAAVDLGTFLGTIPGTVLEMSSPNGYYYRISNATDSSQTAVVAAAADLYYTQAACQGTPHVNFNDPGTPYAAGVNGFVFRDSVGPATANDASTYWMIEAGTQPATVTIVSKRNNGQFCSSVGPMDLLLLPAVANDPAVSAVENAGVPGPVNVGQ